MTDYQIGLEAAKKYGLEMEYKNEVASGSTPRQACQEWDCMPDEWL